MTAFTSLLLALTAAASGAGDYDDRGDDIQLMCYGEAETTVAENHSGFEWDDRKHKYVSKSSVETGKSHFDAAINVSIHDDQGTLRLPKTMVPPLHASSDDGWWTIDNLMVGHNEIRGQFRLNALNKPNLVINRRSGVMTIDGMLNFTGRCEADDGHRRF
ncbi:hypothetical protein Q1W73_12795 [Asticcacaulis sp. ZE23SCel15]|uniref:hypothetical protein n=1 Tax=Asticcacaulis sp. ZE23SCel15 TaxID=3059027 RepID=UPI00265FABB1|nr:hypothetical protein [Asticcacaulis sp. ZE23SCel15]WKL56558.1 hypothetical protein Q1W73_12795 [Asticcacaulis sp. ZE23SCel15]